MLILQWKQKLTGLFADDTLSLRKQNVLYTERVQQLEPTLATTQITKLPEEQMTQMQNDIFKMYADKKPRKQ